MLELRSNAWPQSDKEAFFNTGPSLEVARLEFARSQESKPGNLFVELQAERTDHKLIIQCSSFSVTEC